MTIDTAVRDTAPAHQGDGPVGLFVSPGRDLAAKPGFQSDSWFVTSHLTTARGQLDLLVHVMRMAPPAGGPATVQVMASLLDSSTGRYLSEQQDFPAGACSLATDACDIATPIASVRGDEQALTVSGTWSTAGISCDITVTRAGPALANAGTGLWPMLGGRTYHYALPTMTTTGTVTVDGETLEVTGNSWLDRQWTDADGFFAPSPPRWVWFGVCLDDGTRLSCWDVMEAGRRHRFATVVHPNGAHEVVEIEPTVELAGRPWTSPRTGQTYLTSWDVRLPQIDARLVIEPEVIEQEFAAPDPAYSKYEASAPVTGTLHGRPVTGYATIEAVGHWG